eukprot:189918-Prorocentrum_minimum.AAC.1
MHTHLPFVHSRHVRIPSPSSVREHGGENRPDALPASDRSVARVRTRASRAVGSLRSRRNLALNLALNLASNLASNLALERAGGGILRRSPQRRNVGLVTDIRGPYRIAGRIESSRE